MDTPNHTTSTKRCTKCGRDLPATLEYFARNKRAKSGLYPSCRECKAAAERKYYAEHPERRASVAERTAQRALEFPEWRKEVNRQWRERNREHLRQSSKAWQEANPDKIAAYREQNKEHIREHDRERKAAKRDEINERQRKYYQSHKAEALQRWRTREMRKRGVGGVHTSDDLDAIRAAQTDNQGRLICWHCGKPITDTPHLDHWIPLRHGGPNSAGNLHFMHARCNRSKGAKLPTEIGRLI
jgi:hypothetical protein